MTTYDFLTRRSSDESLARLREQHQKAADDAFALWEMHEEIVVAILAEQNRRPVMTPARNDR